VLGGGVDQDKAPEAASGAPAASAIVSRGLVRSKADKLMLVRQATAAEGQGKAGASPAGGYVQGATALKGELAEPAAVAFGAAAPAHGAETVAEKRAEARMKGYVGEACPECGNFTMVRNGTCLKCDTCGATTGCS
jgi:ribonucleoside-diphosphate reductase alpha chain